MILINTLEFNYDILSETFANINNQLANYKYRNDIYSLHIRINKDFTDFIYFDSHINKEVKVKNSNMILFKKPTNAEEIIINTAFTSFVTLQRFQYYSNVNLNSTIIQIYKTSLIKAEQIIPKYFITFKNLDNETSVESYSAECNYYIK